MQASTPSTLRFNTFYLYIVLCIYRIFNALIIQTQFDPDEYWQTLEPAYCIAFSQPVVSPDNPTTYNCALTWEWTRRYLSPETSAKHGFHTPFSSFFWNRILWGPIRSHVSILPTILFYNLIRYFRLDSNFMVSKGPALLNAVIVAAPTDLSVYLIAYNVFKKRGFKDNDYSRSCAWWALFASVTSWFHGYALVRTYSNSMECMIIMVGIVLLSQDIFHETYEQNRKAPSSRSIIKRKSAFAFFLGGISVSIRFTAIAAWIPIGLIISWKKKTWKDTFNYLVYTCALSGILGILFCTLIDWYFYGFWTIPFLGSFHFNVLLGLGSLYGVHPWHWYLFSGLPAISGALLPFFLYGVYWTIAGKSNHIDDEKELERKKSVQNLLIVVSFYILLHSLSSHKEFRFILPMLPLICVIAGQVMHKSASQLDNALVGKFEENTERQPIQVNRRNKFFLYVFFVLLNYPHLFFLSWIHQAAPISVNKSIVNMMETEKSSRMEQVQTNHLEAEYNVDESLSFSIHYLMGCHSAPVYSHLHVPFTTVDTWTLDCSPRCRADENIPCESDLFHEDPLAFMSKAYELILKHKDSTCEVESVKSDEETRIKSSPNFIAIFESDAAKVLPILEKLEMIEIAKFPHMLSGITFKKEIYFISFQFDNIVLYSKASLSKTCQ